MCSQPMAAPTGASPADKGTFRVGRWMKTHEVVLPRVCVACGADDAWQSKKVGGSDARGKYWAWFQMPLCDHCAAVEAECDHFLGTHGKPKEMKKEHHDIQRAVKFGVKRAFSGDISVNFTFHNRRFYQAFMEANPVPEKKGWGRR